MEDKKFNIKSFCLMILAFLLVILAVFIYYKNESLFNLLLGGGLFALGIGVVLFGIYEYIKIAKTDSTASPALIGICFLISLCPLIVGALLLHDPVLEIKYRSENRKYTELLSIDADNFNLLIGTHGGQKYAVYDYDNDEFIYRALPDNYRASSANEISAIFVTELRTLVVGNYGSADACEYVVDITMVNLETGEILATKSVYGDSPPETIVLRGLELLKSKFYGKKPTYQQLSDACVEMIRETQ